MLGLLKPAAQCDVPAAGTTTASARDSAARRDVSYLAPSTPPPASAPACSSDKLQGFVDISKPRHDLSTFFGRLAHFVSVTSPLTLLASRQELISAQSHVRDVEARLASNPSSALVPAAEAKRYWRDKTLVLSSIHPDTGEPVPLPFRMSAFVPTNLIIVGGMLMPGQGLGGVVFWQWMNQSLNVAVNYSNANKSVPMNTGEVATAYAAAVATSVGIAVSLTRLVSCLRSLSPSARTALSRLVPFASVASAGVVNISCMRWKEIRDGVTVYAPALAEKEAEAERGDKGRSKEEERLPIGKSEIAGTRAVAQTAASRVFTNIPTLILPPLLLTYLQRRGVLSPSARSPATIATNLGLIGASLLVFLPPAIAVFPQTATMRVESLEERFKDVKDPRTGERVEVVEFNRGL